MGECIQSCAAAMSANWGRTWPMPERSCPNLGELGHFCASSTQNWPIQDLSRRADTFSLVEICLLRPDWNFAPRTNVSVISALHSLQLRTRPSLACFSALTRPHANRNQLQAPSSLRVDPCERPFGGDAPRAHPYTHPREIIHHEPLR